MNFKHSIISIFLCTFLFSNSSFLYALSSEETNNEGDNNVHIIGAVKNPGSYQLVSALTIIQLINKAGDVLPSADLQHAKIIKKNAGAVQILQIDLEKIRSGAEKDESLNAEDVVYIPNLIDNGKKEHDSSALDIKIVKDELNPTTSNPIKDHNISLVKQNEVTARNDLSYVEDIKENISNQVETVKKEIPSEVGIVKEDAPDLSLLSSPSQGDNNTVKVPEKDKISLVESPHQGNESKEPLVNGSAIKDLIKTDDTLKIIVLNEKDLSGNFLVEKSGEISFPMIGDIKLEGLEVYQAKKELLERLKKYLVNPQISIIKESAATLNKDNNRVTILGSVKTPGTFPYFPGTTLLKLLATAGDRTIDADLNNVKIFRENEDHTTELIKCDLEKILIGLDKDIPLNISDVVFINRKFNLEGKFISLIGQVNKPGSYAFIEGMTLLKLIAIAGDFKDLASQSNLTIIRKNDKKIKISKVDALKILNGSIPDINLMEEDIVYVPETYVKETNKVTIIGAVKSPGTFLNYPGLTLLKLIALAGDISSDADIDNVRVFRENDRHIKEVFKVNLQRVLTGVDKDLNLENSDVVSIINKKFVGGKTVTLMGQVSKPGPYLFRDGLTLLELIGMASDFKDSANQGNIRVVRKQDKQVKVFKLNAQKILKGKEPDFILEPEDIIYVSESIF